MWLWIGLIAVLTIISVILFCCVRVGAQADREMEKFFEEKE